MKVQQVDDLGFSLSSVAGPFWKLVLPHEIMS